MYDSMPPGPDLQRTVLGPPPDEWGPLYPPWPSFGDHNKPAYCVGALTSDYIKRDLAEAGFCVWEMAMGQGADSLVWKARATVMLSITSTHSTITAFHSIFSRSAQPMHLDATAARLRY